MAAFQKFDLSLIPGVSQTLATLATLAGGDDNSRETPVERKPPGDRWYADDWRHFFGDRAAVLEYDHELPKPEAEARAWEWTITEWLNRNPAPSEPGRCAWCSKPEDVGVVVPFGVEATWLHHECWEPWHQERRDEAHRALSRFVTRTRVNRDIVPNDGSSNTEDDNG